MLEVENGNAFYVLSLGRQKPSSGDSFCMRISKIVLLVGGKKYRHSKFDTFERGVLRVCIAHVTDHIIC